MSPSIELLVSKKHDGILPTKGQRTLFTCGEQSLDEYIKIRASQELKKAISTPFVLTEPPEKRVLGYYCLSSYAIEIADLDEPLAKGLPRYPLLPATLLGRLAVDASCHGNGYGGFLLLDAMRKILEASKKVASAALVVDALNDSATRFYRKHGFKDFPKVPMKLYISIESIGKLDL
jgi:GNAT superfamily N-acetyltransferase